MVGIGLIVVNWLSAAGTALRLLLVKSVGFAYGQVTEKKQDSKFKSTLHASL